MKTRIDAKTRLVGLFGNPVEHSISPIFMNYALSQIGLPYRYIAFNVKEDLLKTSMDSLRALDFRGVNITIPHKSSVIEYLDEIEPEAQKIGAVNCISNDAGNLKGFNTDYRGFIKPMKDRGIILKEKIALVVGCGGAARSVIFALLDEGIGSIYLANRTEEKAIRLIEEFKKFLGSERIIFKGSNLKVTQDTVERSHVIINTTPVGMYPHENHSPFNEDIQFQNRQVVYDLIYNPWETKLLMRARSLQAFTINGFEMLINQGLYSLTIWFPEKNEEIFSLQKSIIDYTRYSLKNGFK